MNIIELQQTYNILIQREKKAELFFENEKVAQAKKDAWIPEFNKITECLSLLMRKYKEITGNEMKDSEVLNGFE